MYEPSTSIWATKTLRDYISDGFVIDKKRIEYNNAQFLRALSDLKLLSENVGQVGSSEATDLALAFATTWLSLDAYDKSALPSSGTIKKAVDIDATDIFATERTKGGLHALFGNVPVFRSHRSTLNNYIFDAVGYRKQPTESFNLNWTFIAQKTSCKISTRLILLWVVFSGLTGRRRSTFYQYAHQDIYPDGLPEPNWVQDCYCRRKRRIP